MLLAKKATAPVPSKHNPFGIQHTKGHPAAVWVFQRFLNSLSGTFPARFLQPRGSCGGSALGAGQQHRRACEGGFPPCMQITPLLPFSWGSKGGIWRLMP